ncbi:MAG: hypothetical protein ACH37Z_07770 [Anaerolineae bacterium]
MPGEATRCQAPPARGRVAVGVGVTVGVRLAVAVGEAVRVGVMVGVGVSVAVGVAVSVGVAVAVGVSVAVGVADGVAVSVGVAEGVGGVWKKRSGFCVPNRNTDPSVSSSKLSSVMPVEVCAGLWATSDQV